MGRFCYFALAAICLALGGLVLAQEPTFKVDVRLVRLLATAKDASGTPVGGLTKDDFQVLDNGTPQEITVFERYTQQPLSVALLMDTSGSTAKDLKYEAEAVTKFLRALFSEGNPNDRVSLFSFNWQVRQETGFTRKVSTLERAAHGLRGEAGTGMYDAIFLAADELAQREGRKVMVIVTDGGDTVSSKRFHDSLESLHRSDAVLYAILVTPITSEAGRNVGGENALQTLAKGTGGIVFAPSIGTALDQSFADILRDLRTQYLIGYYPKNLKPTNERFHKLDVKTTRTGLRVVSRTGYYGDTVDYATAH